MKKTTLANRNFPGVLVAEEKHVSRYFKATNAEELSRNCLRLLKERFDEYYYYEPDKDYEKHKPSLTLEQAEALPLGLIRQTALSEHSHYKRMLDSYNKEMKEFLEIKRILKEKDGDAAFLVLNARSGHEYERVTFESFER